jgi:hypothetical protein
MCAEAAATIADLPVSVDNNTTVPLWRAGVRTAWERPGACATAPSAPPGPAAGEHGTGGAWFDDWCDAVVPGGKVCCPVVALLLLFGSGFLHPVSDGAGCRVGWALRISMGTGAELAEKKVAASLERAAVKAAADGRMDGWMAVKAAAERAAAERAAAAAVRAAAARAAVRVRMAAERGERAAGGSREGGSAVGLAGHPRQAYDWAAGLRL